MLVQISASNKHDKGQMNCKPEIDRLLSGPTSPSFIDRQSVVKQRAVDDAQPSPVRTSSPGSREANGNFRWG